MSKILLQDIVIPKGTIFHRAPIKVERFGETHFSRTIRLTPDSSGDLTYSIDADDPDLDAWFAEVEEAEG